MCQQLAVVLPSQIGFELMKSLEQEGYANVYQGKEIFVERNIEHCF